MINSFCPTQWLASVFGASIRRVNSVCFQWISRKGKSSENSQQKRLGNIISKFFFLLSGCIESKGIKAKSGRANRFSSKYYFTQVVYTNCHYWLNWGAVVKVSSSWQWKIQNIRNIQCWENSTLEKLFPFLGAETFWNSGEKNNT